MYPKWSSSSSNSTSRMVFLKCRRNHIASLSKITNCLTSHQLWLLSKAYSPPWSLLTVMAFPSLFHSLKLSELLAVPVMYSGVQTPSLCLFQGSLCLDCPLSSLSCSWTLSPPKSYFHFLCEAFLNLWRDLIPLFVSSWTLYALYLSSYQLESLSSVAVTNNPAISVAEPNSFISH